MCSEFHTFIKYSGAIACGHDLELINIADVTRYLIMSASPANGRLNFEVLTNLKIALKTAQGAITRLMVIPI